jgi:hypothetical protein
MLKENIAYGFEYEDKLGIMMGSTNSIKDLIKSYMLLGIKHKKDNFDYIEYRGHSISIDDEKGLKDSYKLEEEIKVQINEINKLEDGE